MTLMTLAIILVSFALGFVFRTFLALRAYKADGQIILDKNENGDDRIQFLLGMEYEDFKDHKIIVFDVINKE